MFTMIPLCKSHVQQRKSKIRWISLKIHQSPPYIKHVLSLFYAHLNTLILSLSLCVYSHIYIQCDLSTRIISFTVKRGIRRRRKKVKNIRRGFKKETRRCAFSSLQNIKRAGSLLKIFLVCVYRVLYKQQEEEKGSNILVVREIKSCYNFLCLSPQYKIYVTSEWCRWCSIIYRSIYKNNKKNEEEF